MERNRCRETACREGAYDMLYDNVPHVPKSSSFECHASPFIPPRVSFAQDGVESLEKGVTVVAHPPFGIGSTSVDSHALDAQASEMRAVDLGRAFSFEVQEVRDVPPVVSRRRGPAEAAALGARPRHGRHKVRCREWHRARLAVQ